MLGWMSGLWAFSQRIISLQTEGNARLMESDADAIIVLTGGAGRIDAGTRLLIEGKAPQMLVTGVGLGVTREALLPDLPADYRCCIALGAKAGNTLENAEEAASWIENLAARRVILVTAHYHLPRAMRLFGDRMPEIQWIPYAVQPQRLPLDSWYRHVLGWRLMSSELLKYLVVILFI